MTIQNTRIKIITEKLLKKNLQNGILPSSKEFIWQFNQEMTRAGKNSSSFNYVPFKRNEIAYADTFNDYHADILDNLKVLYDNMAELYYGNDKEFQYFLTEKDKLEKQIDMLSNELQFFIQNNQRAGILPYAYDTFDDNSKIDIFKTNNLVVDTKNNSVKLTEEKNTTRRIYPSKNIEFNLINTGLDKKEKTITGNLNDTITNHEDKIWQHEIRLKEEKEITAVFKYEFTEQWYLNQIDLSFITVKPFQLYCTYSLDGIEWYDLPNYVGSVEAQKDISFNFPSVPIKHFKISITKTQADEVVTKEDDYNFHYLFGLHHVSFYHKQYPVFGELYSKVLEFNNEPENYSINSIRLITDEEIPTGTNIKYQIALANESSPNWQDIDPINRKNPVNPQTISLSRMHSSQEKLFFNDQFSSKQAEAEDLLQNGIPLYRLSQIRENKEYLFIAPRKIREGSLSLMLGVNAWEILSFPVDTFSQYPKIEDFDGVFPDTKIWYLKQTEDHNGYLFKNHKEASTKRYMARIAIYMKEPQTITTRPVSSSPYSLYLNNELMIEGNKDTQRDIHLSFRPGWNEIVVLLNGAEVILTNGMTFLLGFNPNKISDNIYSRSKGLKEVSLFDLRYNTKRHDRTVFAKREVEGGWEILTNFWYPGLNFELSYDYKTDDLPEHDNLILKATFTREDGLNIPTPILRSYRLECN